MRRAVLATFVLTGCSFMPGHPSAESTVDAGGSQDPTADAAVTSTTPTSGTCKYPGTTLCFDFRAGFTTPVRDQSGGNHDAAAAISALGAVMRGTDPAAYIYRGNTLNVAESKDLDLASEVSFEMWLRPDGFGPGTISMPLTNNGQYAMRLEADGRITCLLGTGSAVTSAAHLAANVWSHVACTYDGDTLRVYIAGSSHECNGQGGSIPTSGTTGTQIGAGYAGGIDDVHLYPAELSGDDVCAHAGATSCQVDCNQ